MKNLLRILLVVIVIGALAGGGYWVYTTKVAAQGTSSSAGGDGSYTQTVTAQLGNLSSSLTVVGQVEAVQQVTLKFEHMTKAGRLQDLKVTPGNTVASGGVLATIDAAPYRQAVDQAQSDLQSAAQKLADLQTPVTSLQLAQADLAVAKAEQSVAQTKADLADLGDTDLTDLQAAVKSAQDDLKLAQLQRQLAAHDSLAKSERGLQYSIGWHERRIADLQALVAQGKANAEQTASITTEQESLSEAHADLAKVQAERELSIRSADAAVAKARATVTDAIQALADAQAGDELKIAQAELAVRNAEFSVASAKDKRAKLNEGPDATELAAAKADVDKKQLALEDAQTALAGTQLVAPFAGTVLQTNVSTGDTIAANTPILTLANLDQLRVLAAIDETTIQRVQAGQPATITFDAQPGVTLTGAVGEVPLQGSLSGGVMTYEVPIALTGATNLPLLTGMTANVVIATGSVENALLIPSMALTKSNGLYYVRVPNTVDPAAEPETVPVQVGLSDGTYTQIVAGLVEGDQILVSVTSSTSANFRGFGIMFDSGGAGGPPERPRR